MDDLVTVFGASGFVGSNVVRMLARDGWRIRAAVRNPHLERSERLRVHGYVGQIETVAANIRNPASVARALEGAVACVNLVGVLHESGRQRLAAIHAAGARNVAEAAAHEGVERFVHVSAIGADAGSASRYARSKAEGEAAVRERVPGAVIMRPSIIFGAEDQFFNKFAAMAAMSPALPLIGGGRTRFQPVYVADVGRAIVTALDTPGARGATFELGGPTVYSLRKIMELVLAETGRRRALVPLPFFAASALGAGFELFARVSPFAPPITRDQVEQLKHDNLPARGTPGLAELGITPVAAEGVIGSYLYQYRRAGQFSTLEPQKSASGARP
jgi:NADH dehydrogenase